MSIRQFEPSRAVEIITPKYGSGYRIGGRLVLTAAHLLSDVSSICEVRDKQSFRRIGAQVVWKAKGLDIALIELPEWISDLEAITLGKLPKTVSGEKLSFQMYGFPLWARTQREQGSAAGGRQIEGLIYLSDRSPDGLLVLEAKRLPPEATTNQSEWAGTSGATVICDDLVIAVHSQHQNPRRSASLEATALRDISADKQWKELLKKHGISAELEAVRTSSTISPSKEKPNLVSEKEINYTRLQKLLKEGKWRDADLETHSLMLLAFGKKSDYLPREFINFPCKDLQTIDRLWYEQSGGRFGFRVQKKIWQECGAPQDTGSYYYFTDWDKFCVKVGWSKRKLADLWLPATYLYYDQLKADLRFSPMGEFPCRSSLVGVGRSIDFSGFLYKKIERDQLHPAAGRVSIFTRLEGCQGE